MGESQGAAKTGLMQSPRADLEKRSASLVRRGLQLLSSENTRAVFFPSDCSIGRVFAADNRNLASNEESSNIDLGNARGRILVPADCELELYLDTEGPADFSRLIELKPNDLQNIVVHPRCVVKDYDLQYLRPLSGLLRLSLNCQFDISNVGLNYVAGLTSLRYLDMTMAYGVTSGGLKNLARMQQLEHLILLGTRLDDKAVAPLGMLTSLKYLNLEHTYISKQGVAALQVLLKECLIMHKERPRGKVEEEMSQIGSDREGEARADPNRKSLSERVRQLGGIRPSDV